MIITRAEVESAVSAYRTARKKKAHAAPSVHFDTRPAHVRYVSSAEAATLAELAVNVIADPTYREVLVEDLQQRVATETYCVPSEQIVERLLRRLVVEALPA